MLSTHLFGWVINDHNASQFCGADIFDEVTKAYIFTPFINSPMPDDEYYVKVSVDGVQVDDGDLCDGSPTSADCKFQVTYSVVFVLHHLKYL